jgi:hypothetical protein
VFAGREFGKQDGPGPELQSALTERHESGRTRFRASQAWLACRTSGSGVDLRTTSRPAESGETQPGGETDQAGTGVGFSIGSPTIEPHSVHEPS